MDWIQDFFLNKWTISIFTGIISSVIAHLCISLYTKRKANKVRLQKISTANNEILYAIRPLIVDSKMPKPNLLRSLINSTARKYGLVTNDLYTPEVIIEELTKEILENMFLPTQDKLKLCEDFDTQIVRNDIPKKNRPMPEISNRESRITTLASILVAIMTMIVTMITLTDNSINLNIDSNFSRIYISVILLFVASIFALLIIQSLKRHIRVKDALLDISKEIDTEPKKGIIEYERLARKLDDVDVLNAWMVYKKLGAFYANIQKNELSVLYYAKAIAAFPSINQDKDARGELYILRGGVLKRLGVDSFAEALSSIEKGLILVSDDHLKGDAYYNMACIYAKLNEKEKFNDIMMQKIPRLKEKEIQNVKQRIEHWLHSNAPEYLELMG